MGAAITQDGGKFNHFKQKIFLVFELLQEF